MWPPANVHDALQPHHIEKYFQFRLLQFLDGVSIDFPNHVYRFGDVDLCPVRSTALLLCPYSTHYVGRAPDKPFPILTFQHKDATHNAA